MKRRLNGMILALLMTISTLLLSTGCPGEIRPPKIIKVSAGGYHTVLLKDDGTVWVTGRNDKGQLGLSGTYFRSSFTQVPNLSGIIDISAGWDHTVAVKSDGTVWVTGETFSGQLGLGADQNPRFEFTRVPNLTDVVAISAGDMHTVALKRDGTVWGTGSNGSGQLGLGNSLEQGNPANVDEFTLIPGVSNVKKVSTGRIYTLVLDVNGSLWGAGSNSYGQLGLGSSLNSYTFTQLPGVCGVKDMSGRYFHTLVVRNDGTVWGTGENKYGELGLGTTDKQTTFTKLPSISNASGVATGSGFSIVILNDGRVYATGWNDEGQLGLGDKNDRHTFTAVPRMTDIKYGAAGASHTVLLKNNGEVLSSGSNKYGQLGIVASGR